MLHDNGTREIISDLYVAIYIAVAFPHRANNNEQCGVGRQRLRSGEREGQSECFSRVTTRRRGSGCGGGCAPGPECTSWSGSASGSAMPQRVARSDTTLRTHAMCPRRFKRSNAACMPAGQSASRAMPDSCGAHVSLAGATALCEAVVAYSQRLLRPFRFVFVLVKPRLLTAGLLASFMYLAYVFLR